MSNIEVPDSEPKLVDKLPAMDGEVNQDTTKYDAISIIQPINELSFNCAEIKEVPGTKELQAKKYKVYKLTVTNKKEWAKPEI